MPETTFPEIIRVHRLFSFTSSRSAQETGHPFNMSSRSAFSPQATQKTRPRSLSRMFCKMDPRSTWGLHPPQNLTVNRGRFPSLPNVGLPPSQPRILPTASLAVSSSLPILKSIWGIRKSLFQFSSRGARPEPFCAEGGRVDTWNPRIPDKGFLAP